MTNRIFTTIFTEEDLILLKRRDPIILETIFKEYSERIFNYLVLKTNGNTSLAEELLSDTFHSVIVSAPKLSDINKVFPWILKIADRSFMDFLRKKYRNKKHETDTEINENHADTEDLSEKLIENEKILMMKHALEKMNPEYRRILTLKYIENKTQKEIAEITGKSESSIESLLFRSREALKKELSKIKKAYL